MSENNQITEETRGYPVRVVRRAGMFELRIDELLISARAPDLQSALDHLRQREKILREHVTLLGPPYVLPVPSAPPPVRSTPADLGASRGAASQQKTRQE